jgi:hypothetical protein
MKITKFVVKVNRSGTRVPEYVERVDPSPIHMTTNRKLALVMRNSWRKTLCNLFIPQGAARS